MLYKGFVLNVFYLSKCFLSLRPNKKLRFQKGTENFKRKGKPLANGFYGCLLQVQGDLDYLTKWLDVPRSMSSKPCALCKCTLHGAMSYIDNREEAAWRNTFVTTQNWMDHWQGTSAIYQLPGITALSIALDYMHNCYLGFQNYVYGSCFYILTHEAMPGTPLENLKVLETFLKDFQKRRHTAHRYRHRLCKLSMFMKASGFPKLKGRAADIKGLDEVMVAMWENWMGFTNLQHRQIRLLLKLNLDIARILDEYAPRHGHLAVPEPMATNLKRKGQQLAQVHAQLTDHYKEQDKRLFNFTAKLHFCQHSLGLAKFVHPSLVWCFKGETTMRSVQRLWKSCLDGRKHWQVGRSAAMKYRHLMHLRRNKRD